MNKYQPNFNHAKVKARIQRALAFIEQTFRIKSAEVYLNRNTIDHRDNLGISSNNLSRYLRDVLLICTDSSYRFDSGSNKPKRYRANHLGVSFLREILDGTTTTTNWYEYRDLIKQQHYTTHNNVLLRQQNQLADRLFEKYQSEIESGNFSMRQRSNREFHELQNIPRDIRAVKFAQQGYCFDYDIETAAPTLLLQRARNQGFDKPTAIIDYFLQNKNQIRMIIAQDCEITYAQAKQVITALFQGGRISCFHTNRIYKETLNYNRAAVTALNQNPLVTALKQEISLMWRALGKNLPREQYQDSRGITKTRMISGRTKAEIYRQTEEVIMKEIKKYLKKKEKGIRVITEHDGWRCDRIIDRDQLTTHVRRTTGYLINIDYNKIDI